MDLVRATEFMDRTTISVSEEVADALHDLKRRGESYDDVLRRLLADTGEDVDGTDGPGEEGESDGPS